MTKTEEAARAMFSTWRETMILDGDDVAGSFEELDDKERAFALMQARTAIEAMMEPTAEMLLAGMGQVYVPEIWRAMHAAALKEQP